MPDDMSMVPYNGGNLDVVLYVLRNFHLLLQLTVKQPAQRLGGGLRP